MTTERKRNGTTGRIPIPVDRLKSEQILIRIDPPTAKKLRAAAAARGVTLSAFVREQALKGMRAGRG